MNWSRKLVLRSAALLCGVSGAAIGLGDAAWAQEAAPAKAQGASLEEVVVTARRREERLQDVPIAVAAFTPERFNDPEEAEACRRAYMPFGKGPRICIGAGFAQQEGLLVLASIVRAFRLRYPDIRKPEPVSRLTLRPKKAVQLWFDSRAR